MDLLNSHFFRNSSKKNMSFCFKIFSGVIKEKQPILGRLILNSINYFNDIVKVNKKFRKPDLNEKKALQDLAEQVAKMKPSMTPEEMQTIVYSVGKIHYSKERLREWFKMIYEVLFGEEQGPRMGSFISFYGIKETVSLINNSIRD